MCILVIEFVHKGNKFIQLGKNYKFKDKKNTQHILTFNIFMKQKISKEDSKEVLDEYDLFLLKEDVLEGTANDLQYILQKNI